ncbi:hypothetical protein [uncultured Roseateles sp.]|uniref:hypothetical protein n=1 Tax=Roseateles chitinivorans TaxID=2917965 RepID=UPI002619E21B|nr:hypothetical protein [uncultured Roseateles sp.]
MSTMTDSDRNVIRRYAAGDRALRIQAIEAFCEHQASHAGTPEIRLMAEATSLVPDHLLQAQYRRQMAPPGASAHTAFGDSDLVTAR